MTGIICAMSSEAESLGALLQNPEKITAGGITFTEGKLEGKDVVLSVCGVGKVFAAICAQTMILTYKPDEIINLGVAGGLEPTLRIADIVVANSVCQYDMDTSPLGDPVGMISGINMIYLPCDKRLSQELLIAAEKCGLRAVKGTVASGDRFVSDKNTKKYIRDTFGAAACEMEGGAVGQVCYAAGVPFCVLRSISDGGDDSAKTDYVTFLGQATANGDAVILAYLRG